MTQTDQWNPHQYARFREQRMQPFFDLIAAVRVRPGMRIVDLGCGPGELTALLAERFPDSHVTGIDSSRAMLAQAAPLAGERLRFELGDIGAIADFSGYDLVFSHAALQWVPDNEGLMVRLLGTLRPGAQVAVQVPNNEEHPSHRGAQELAAEPPFDRLLGGFVRRSEILTLEQYASMLYDHGLREQLCYEKIYGHELPSTSDVVEWVKGTSLGAYLSRLDDSGKDAFLSAYRARLASAIGEHAPYFYPFRRLLFWGVKE